MNLIAAYAHSTWARTLKRLQTWALVGAVALAGLLGAGQALAASSGTFVDHGDGTVTDTSTGLMWDQCLDGMSDGTCGTGTPTPYNWANALGLAATRNSQIYKGYTDWRLPSIVELKTLVKGTTNPTIDLAAFPNTPGANFWSASTKASFPIFAWIVVFGYGDTSANFKTSPGFVRLVRSGQCFGSFALLPVGVSAAGTNTAMLAATSATDATGYWIVLPRGAATPSVAQVMTPGNYSAATVAASGSSAMAAKTPVTFNIAGLVQGSPFDLYMVALDPLYALTSCMVATQFSTVPIATSAIVIDPVTPTTLYAGLDGGGVYTKVGAGNWTAASTQPTNLNVKALVIKSDSSMLFAGTDGGGVFKSNNNGMDWAVCKDASNVPNSGLTNLNLRSLALAGTTLYAGTTAGVFVSTDSCASWAALNTGMP